MSLESQKSFCVVVAGGGAVKITSALTPALDCFRMNEINLNGGVWNWA